MAITIEREANGVDHVADEWFAVTGLAEQSQAQDRDIAGNDAQPVLSTVNNRDGICRVFDHAG